MGSGTSKPKPVPQKSTTKSPEKENGTVTNVNNKSPDKRKGNVHQKGSGTPVKTKSNASENKSPKKSKKSKDSDWSSDSDFEDDLDEFIKETVSHAAKTNSSNTNNEEPVSSRPRTSHGRTTSRPENAYPETYAQKHTREQYTVDRQALIRQKTIYRNPDDWKDDSEESEEEHGGFDASKFRQVNTHNDPNQESVVKEFETPRYITSKDGRRESSYGIYEKEREKPDYSRRISKVPAYDLEEQRLLADLENEF
ncbi:hypothetical protein LOTGIDRAFT_237707 [Lottia gigantea]|uniref:Uncharacterized protein n=1 Tax=Lottia gigantea TaxID=225164 RepID=V4AHA0_LOTGI|nr:hypothetical protein LOTGIDRAFT_237707 [Lottia gigantea]ESP03399.1 hypothetical protein LOTGIDRAFT_237707 [Lottia gigantea]